MAKARKKTAESSVALETAPADSFTSETETFDSIASDPVSPQDTGDTTAANLDRQRVASRAYELYIARGAQHGRALDDWLEAEQELLQSTRRTRDRE